MTPTRYTYDASTNEWVFPNGKRLRVISGGDPTADPEAVPVIVVPGEPVTPVVPAVPTAPEAKFTAEDIENARKQEKEKLYGRLEGLEQQTKLFQQEREEALRATAEAQAEADAERKRKEEEELGFKDLLLRKEDEWSSKFQSTQTEWAERFAAIEAERDAHAALLDKERQFQALEAFKQRRIVEEGDNLMPHLHKYITGDSEEAIESSISAARDTTSAIVDEVSQLVPSRPAVRPVPATGQAPSGPSENMTGQQTYTMDQLKNMDMASYAANRERLLAAVSRRGN